MKAKDASQEESLRYVIDTIEQQEKEIQSLHKKLFEANELLSEKIRKEQMLKYYLKLNKI